MSDATKKLDDEDEENTGFGDFGSHLIFGREALLEGWVWKSQCSRWVVVKWRQIV